MVNHDAWGVDPHVCMTFVHVEWVPPAQIVRPSVQHSRGQAEGICAKRRYVFLPNWKSTEKRGWSIVNPNTDGLQKTERLLALSNSPAVYPFLLQHLKLRQNWSASALLKCWWVSQAQPNEF